MLELLGKKYFHVFTAGEYPQGNVSVEQLLAISAVYDPKFKEAPIWRGHPNWNDEGGKEPEALGWIKSLLVYGDKLYAEFCDVTEELVELLDEKKFKYCSVELVRYMINNTETPYLFALGLTNRPAVHGLEPIQFPPRFAEAHKMNNDFISNTRIAFNFNFPNSKQTLMNQYLVNLAKTAGVDPSKYTDESKLADAVDAKLKERDQQFSDQAGRIKTLEANKPVDTKVYEDKIADLEKRLDAAEAQIYNELVDAAIAAGKIEPAQKDYFVNAAKANFDGTKAYLDSLKPSAMFKADVTNTGAAPVVNLTDAKFKKADGTPYTYAEVIKDSKLVQNFTTDELLKLRKDPVLGLK